MDINIGETPAGRIKMELFNDIVPKLACFYEARITVAEGDPELQKTSANCAQASTGTSDQLMV